MVELFLFDPRFGEGSGGIGEDETTDRAIAR